MKVPLHVAQPPLRRRARNGGASLAPAFVAVLLAAFVAAGCSDGNGARQPRTGPEPPEPPLAAGAIGPAGGSIAVTEGPHAGVALTIAAGAVGSETNFTIWFERDESEVPSVFPMYRFEPTELALDGESAAVTVRAAAPFFSEGSPLPGTLVLFTRRAANDPFEVLRFVSTDTTAQTVTAATDRLGRFVATNGALHRLFTQGLEPLDPSVATCIEKLPGAELTIANGSGSVLLGRGSLEAFWSAPASANVLILHGLARTPLDFRGPNDLPQSLAPSVQNVVLLVYPSGLGVAATANALYDLIRARQQPGFGCTIIGHSLGGNVARYLIERSAGDTSRPGYHPSDVPLSEVVAKLFMIGTPNGGSSIACHLLAKVQPNLPPQDTRFVRAGLDLLEGSGTFAADQVASYQDNPTIYHSIVGDIGDGTDGIVTLASTRALPLVPPESEVVFVQSHVDLHRNAANNGVAAWINARLPQP